MIETPPGAESQPIPTVRTAEETITEIKRYLERFGPGDMRSQVVIVEALHSILGGAPVVWSPMDRGRAAEARVVELEAIIKDVQDKLALPYPGQPRDSNLNRGANWPRYAAEARNRLARAFPTGV